MWILFNVTIIIGIVLIIEIYYSTKLLVSRIVFVNKQVQQDFKKMIESRKTNKMQLLLNFVLLFCPIFNALLFLLMFDNKFWKLTCDLVMNKLNCEYYYDKNFVITKVYNKVK